MSKVLVHFVLEKYKYLFSSGTSLQTCLCMYKAIALRILLHKKKKKSTLFHTRKLVRDRFFENCRAYEQFILSIESYYICQSLGASSITLCFPRSAQSTISGDQGQPLRVSSNEPACDGYLYLNIIQNFKKKIVIKVLLI